MASLKKLTVLEAPPAQPLAVYKAPDDTSMTLSDYHGKVVLLNVWATWCPPCVAEMPSLNALEGQMGGSDFAVVPISLDRLASDILPFYEDADIENLPAWHDDTFGLSGSLILPGLPTSILYDRRGREIGRIPGEVDWDSVEAIALIEHLTAASD
ncbi:MAG: TlpA disulfide reductase family protein [Litorimonas sp.]